jgi:hypothetical protein
MNAQTNDDQLEFRSGWPNWANFRMFGRLFSLGCFFEHYIQNEPKLLGCLFHGKSYALILTKMFFFPQAPLVTLVQVMSFNAENLVQ